MDIAIAILTWFVLGGVLSFFFSVFTASIARGFDKESWGCSLWSIVLSCTRLFIIFYLVKHFTGMGFKSYIFIALLIADILWGLLMMKWSSESWGMGSNTAMYKTGVCIGSIVFAIAFFVKIYI